MVAGKRPILYDHELGEHDLLDVNDAVRGCLLAAESDRSDGRIYNIAAGRATQTEDLVQRLNALLGTQIEPLLAGPCANVPAVPLPDGKRALVELGFAADLDSNEHLRELHSRLPPTRCDRHHGVRSLFRGTLTPNRPQVCCNASTQWKSEIRQSDMIACEFQLAAPCFSNSPYLCNFL